MFERFPKKGKKSSRPGKDTAPKSEEMGSPYFFRHEKGGEEVRMREVYDNDYGKKTKDRSPTDKGFPVSPRRTMITGS